MKRLAVIVLTALLISASQAAALTVTISPELIDIDDTAHSFDVVVKDATDLGAFEFSLKYDPSIVTIETVTLGDFLESTGRLAWSDTHPDDMKPVIDNIGGTVKYADFTWGTAAGPNGEGILAIITFLLKKQTATPLTFDPNRSYITDTKGNALPAQWIGGKITQVCKINANAGSCGTIAPSGEVSAECGTDKTFTITSDVCHTIKDVIVNGVSVGVVSSYTFEKVDGDSNTIAISCDSNPIVYTINAAAGNGGAISPSGEVPVNCGSDKTFTISPNSCYHISDVKADGVSVSSYEFKNITANHNISADFAKNQCKITSSATPPAGGSISPSPDVTVACGENISFTIKPNPNYRIEDVVADGKSVKADVQTNADGSGSYTFKNVVCGNNETVHNIDAVFDVISYTITPSVEVIEKGAPPFGGTIEPSQPVTVAKGSDRTFTMTPYACYKIADVKVDGVSVMTEVVLSADGTGTYTFGNVTASHGITVYFTSKKYLIKLGKSIGGAISQSKSSYSVSSSDDETLAGIVNVPCGYWLSVKITPEDCYEIKEVRVDGAAVDFQKQSDGSAQYDFMDEKEHRIDADFVKKKFVIQVSSEGEGSVEACSGDVCEKIDLPCEISVECGGNQTFEFSSSEDDCQVAEVRVEGQVNGLAQKSCNYSFQNVKENHRLFVIFNTRIITASAGEHGTIEPSGKVSVQHGGDKSFTIKPDETYKIADVRIDDRYSGMANVTIDDKGVGTYTFKDVTQDHSIHVLFTPHIITASAGEHGKIEQSGEVRVEHDGKVSFTIMPDNCYQIADVKADDVSVMENVTMDEKGVGTYTFENVTQSHTIAVTFRSFGDINKDGVVNLSDAVWGLNHNEEIDPTQVIYALELLTDMEVSLKDAVLYLRILAGYDEKIQSCRLQCGKIDLAEVVRLLNLLTEK
jgi:hypothetical protein